MNAQERKQKMDDLRTLRESLAYCEKAVEMHTKDIAALEAELSAKWEPEGGRFVVGADGSVRYGDEPFKPFAANGHAYPTREKAESAAAAMRPCNRLIAYLVEHDEPGDWYPVFSHGVREWCAARAMPGRRDPTKLYRSERVIRELCRKLNDGEVVL